MILVRRNCSSQSQCIAWSCDLLSHAAVHRCKYKTCAATSTSTRLYDGQVQVSKCEWGRNGLKSPTGQMKALQVCVCVIDWATVSCATLWDIPHWPWDKQFVLSINGLLFILVSVLRPAFQSQLRSTAKRSFLPDLDKYYISALISVWSIWS